MHAIHKEEIFLGNGVSNITRARFLLRDQSRVLESLLLSTIMVMWPVLCDSKIVPKVVNSLP